MFPPLFPDLWVRIWVSCSICCKLATAEDGSPPQSGTPYPMTLAIAVLRDLGAKTMCRGQHGRGQLRNL